MSYVFCCTKKACCKSRKINNNGKKINITFKENNCLTFYQLRSLNNLPPKIYMSLQMSQVNIPT